MVFEKGSPILLLLLSIISFASAGQKTSKSKLNITGSYTFDGKTIKKDGDTYGYFGEVRVKLLSNDKIAVSFYLCTGAKSYNSGSFVDTLKLTGNKAIFRPLDCDSLCTLTFIFSNNGLRTIHKAADDNYNFSCCFGHGVVANGYFRKVSSKTPIIKDLLRE